MRKQLYTALLLAIATSTGIFAANPDGGISPEMLSRIKTAYADTPADRAARNAISTNDIDRLAINARYRSVKPDTHFSHKVPGKGITDQRSSGRCWLFTGLNVLRSQIMMQHDLDRLELSQNYNFFFDQLEKSNLFLQGMIDYSDRPIDDKMVDWLFRNPLSDGGQYTGLSENIMKYGIVPAEAMTETYSSNNTAKMRRILSTKLREYGLELRRMSENKATAQAMQQRKEEMLGQVYRILALTLGEPPVEFTWTRRDSGGNIVDTRTYSPLDFYREYAGNDLKGQYVMLMNDPTRPYHRLYEIDFDRHNYDGANWTYINLPMDEIKKMAIESIKDSTMMYFSCDVGKFLDRELGMLDTATMDYESLFGVDFPMDKADRIRTYASGSTHAMTLMAVDLDADGKPRKWMVENSWGNGANNGHLIITDRWMDEYMFRLVVNKKYVPAKTLRILDTKPTLLPPWDPMFAPEE